MATPITPAPMRVRTARNADTFFNFVSNMAFNTPSARAATLTETAPVAATCPAANTLAAWTVETTTEFGTAADATWWDSAAVKALADPSLEGGHSCPPRFWRTGMSALPQTDSTPRRASRFANIARALANRPATVPSG